MSRATLRRWAPLVAALLVVGLLVSAWNGRRVAVHEAERLAEAADLRAQGLTVEVQATRAHLARVVAFLAEKDAALAAALADARRKAPTARPVAALDASTGPVVAPGTSRRCLLSEGDTGEVRTRQVTLRTDKGNAIVVGTAEAWRLSPDTLLLSGPFAASLTNAAELAPPSPLGWAGGVSASCSRAGCSVGPAISAPPWRILGGQVEASAGVPFVGAGLSLNASILYRR